MKISYFGNFVCEMEFDVDVAEEKAKISYLEKVYEGTVKLTGRKLIFRNVKENTTDSISLITLTDVELIDNSISVTHYDKENDQNLVAVLELQQPMKKCRFVPLFLMSVKCFFPESFVSRFKVGDILIDNVKRPRYSEYSIYCFFLEYIAINNFDVPKKDIETFYELLLYAEETIDTSMFSCFEAIASVLNTLLIMPHVLTLKVYSINEKIVKTMIDLLKKGIGITDIHVGGDTGAILDLLRFLTGNKDIHVITSVTILNITLSKDVVLTLSTLKDSFNYFAVNNHLDSERLAQLLATQNGMNGFLGGSFLCEELSKSQMKHFGYLGTLNLSNCNLEINSVLNSAGVYLDNLQFLSLSGNYCNSGPIETFPKRLIMIELNNVKWEGNSIITILNVVFEKMPDKFWLNLSDVNLNDSRNDELMEFFGKQNARRIGFFRFNNNKTDHRFFNFFKEAISLESLSLINSMNKTDKKSLKAFTEALKFLKSLRVLRISSNKLGENIVNILRSISCTTLLDISDNNLDSRMLKSSLEMIFTIPNLKTLIFDQNNLTFKFLTYVCKHHNSYGFNGQVSYPVKTVRELVSSNEITGKQHEKLKQQWTVFSKGIYNHVWVDILDRHSLSVSAVSNPLFAPLSLFVHYYIPDFPYSVGNMFAKFLKSNCQLVHTPYTDVDPSKVQNSKEANDLPKVQSSKEVDDPSKVQNSKDVNDFQKVQSSKDVNDLPKVQSSKEVDDPSKVQNSKDVNDFQKVQSSKEANDPSKVQNSKDVNDFQKVQSSKEADDPSKAQNSKKDGDLLGHDPELKENLQFSAHEVSEILHSREFRSNLDIKVEGKSRISAENSIIQKIADNESESQVNLPEDFNNAESDTQDNSPTRRLSQISTSSSVIRELSYENLLDENNDDNVDNKSKNANGRGKRKGVLTPRSRNLYRRIVAQVSAKNNDHEFVLQKDPTLESNEIGTEARKNDDEPVEVKSDKIKRTAKCNTLSDGYQNKKRRSPSLRSWEGVKLKSVENNTEPSPRNDVGTESLEHMRNGKSYSRGNVSTLPVNGIKNRIDDFGTGGKDFKLSSGPKSIKSDYGPSHRDKLQKIYSKKDDGLPPSNKMQTRPSLIGSGRNKANPDDASSKRSNSQQKHVSKFTVSKGRDSASNSSATNARPENMTSVNQTAISKLGLPLPNIGENTTRENDNEISSRKARDGPRSRRPHLGAIDNRSWASERRYRGSSQTRDPATGVDLHKDIKNDQNLSGYTLQHKISSGNCEVRGYFYSPDAGNRTMSKSSDGSIISTRQGIRPLSRKGPESRSTDHSNDNTLSEQPEKSDNKNRVQMVTRSSNRTMIPKKNTSEVGCATFGGKRLSCGSVSSDKPKEANKNPVNASSDSTRDRKLPLAPHDIKKQTSTEPVRNKVYIGKVENRSIERRPEEESSLHADKKAFRCRRYGTGDSHSSCSSDSEHVPAPAFDTSDDYAVNDEPEDDFKVLCSRTKSNGTNKTSNSSGRQSINFDEPSSHFLTDEFDDVKSVEWSMPYETIAETLDDSVCTYDNKLSIPSVLSTLRHIRNV